MIRPADLRTPQALELETHVAGTDPLAGVTAVRRAYPDVDPALISALATQARLRALARPRLDPWARDMVLSDAGLQQASRARVSLHRATELARRLGAAGGTVADLGCGLGVDALGLAAAGFDVRAVERDPWTAEAAQVNGSLCGGRIHVICADATAVDLDGCVAAYCDPARRDLAGPANRAGTRSRAVGDPARWSPPWPWVRGLAERLPVVAKAAPALSASHVPPSAEREWIACDGEVVETCVWFAPLATTLRRATALDATGMASISTLDPVSDAAGPVATFLIEPSPAVIRAGLRPALAARLGVAAVRGSDRWLTASAPIHDPLARTWVVVRPLPADPLELRSTLRDRGAVTWKTRDIAMRADDMDRRVGHRAARGGRPVTVAWVRVGREPQAFEVTAPTP